MSLYSTVLLHGCPCMLLPSGACLTLMPGRPGAVPESYEVGWRALSKVCALSRQQDTAWSSLGLWNAHRCDPVPERR